MRISILIFCSLIFVQLANSQVMNEKNLHCNTRNIKSLENFQSGTRHLENSEIKLAIRDLERAVLYDSTFCDAWSNLAIAHQKAANFEKSYWSAINALVIDSTFSTPWITIGYTFFLSGDYNKSLVSFGHLKNLRPDNPEGYYGSSFVLYSMSTLDKAQQELEIAKEKYQESKIPISNEVKFLEARILFEKSEYSKSRDLLESIYSDYKDDAVANYYLGVCILRTNGDSRDNWRKFILKAKREGYKIDDDINELIK